MNTSIRRHLLVLTIVAIMAPSGQIVKGTEIPSGPENIGFHQPQLMNSFYRSHGSAIFWFAEDIYHHHLREALIQAVSESEHSGLKAAKYHLQLLRQYHNNVPREATQAVLADHLFTDAAITLCKDLYQGDNINQWLSYDGISKKYGPSDDTFILNSLLRMRDASELSGFINGLEPMGMNYQLLKRELRDCSTDCNELKVRQLATSMNYFRWITHFQLDSFIIVNISSATLRYYVHDSLALEMRAVVGKPDTKTPRFAAYCKEVTLYPYWNMPRSIAVNEWLPSFRKNPRMLTFLNMEVINAAGKAVDPEAIDWKHISVQHFPYRIRQKTGCLNPLGVIKFTLTSPFDIYMHDTNFKGAFEAKNRYYSHGCIRLQEPTALANALLVDKVDTAFLAACYKDQLPKVIPIANPVPVFVVYLPAEVNEEGSITYYKDIYHLLK